MCIRFAQRDSNEECTWYACELYRADVAKDNALKVCRFAAGHFATPTGTLTFVVLFAFVCAGGDHHCPEDPGSVLTIVNCASALLFLLQIDGLVRDLAYRNMSLTKLQAEYESLERAHLALRDLHSGEDMPHAKKARSVNE